MTPEELRAEVPALGSVAYMNFGASGPSPHRVVDAAESCLEHHEYDAPVSEGMYPAAFDLYDDTRETVAGFVGAETDKIALTQSTTDGINRIAGAMEWAEGDVVVRTDLEHPAGVLPWDRLERNRGVEVRVVGTERGRIDMDAYREAVEGAKLVCFSALTWTHGTRLPVAELVDIAHDAGAFVLVDAVQVPGQAPMNVDEWGADAVAAAGHKWLLGNWGAGFLYVDDDAVGDLEPAAIGYRGVEDAEGEYEWHDGAARFEIGTTSPAPYAALGEAIEICEEIGVEAIEERIQTLAARLADGVPEERLRSPATPESGLVTIAVDDPEATVERLANEGVVVRDLPHPEAIRASVHAVNTAEEVDLLLDALGEEW
ncbi:Selenocysteine lyase/Cysteine desulfurase [Natronoarchaeum philippinense]|uniref:Selenocysteine lyase/Cysteine desulfurase n=1 Tax=Natronoarchaeum philippinense TaxID=558529 RepID=A0A285N2W7_NATPI|nr:aminotransferase class V-fold PLP-dependent enzyme [Natronoarchaeum philippinense]SNZ03770.1 Selenocysteine lyase/Cysteine desulfurase [Natronoarchaeum philippinense]